MMRYNFDEMIDRKGTYSTQWDFIEDRFGEKDLLPFSISDTDFKVPEPVTEALKKRLSHPVFGYTRWNHSDFKKAVTDWYHKRFQAFVREEWILYSPAVCYSLSLLIQLKSKPGDRVVVFSPMYDAFYQVIEQNGRILEESPLKNEDGRYRIDFERLEAQLKDARILLLTNPHNPTGRVFTVSELQALISLCDKYGVFLISDDIHMDIVYPENRYTPVFTLMKQKENCCVCSSASKTMNTPGLMGSYLIVPDESLREQFLMLLKGRDALSSVSILGMEAMIAGYRDASDYVDQLVAYLGKNMLVIHQFMKERLPLLSFIPPEGTYLAWIDARGLGLTDEEIKHLLVQRGKVGIMSGETYGRSGYLRMNAGCSRQKLLDGLERMERALKK